LDVRSRSTSTAYLTPVASKAGSDGRAADVAGRDTASPVRIRTATYQGLHFFQSDVQDMHMRWVFLTDEAKKKLWRPCREARALGL
jgi:hypothetical protein